MFSQRLVTQGQGLCFIKSEWSSENGSLCSLSWPSTAWLLGLRVVSGYFLLLGKNCWSLCLPLCMQSAGILGLGPPGTSLSTGSSRLTWLVPPFPSPALPAPWFSPHSTPSWDPPPRENHLIVQGRETWSTELIGLLILSLVHRCSAEYLLMTVSLASEHSKCSPIIQSTQAKWSNWSWTHINHCGG